VHKVRYVSLIDAPLLREYFYLAMTAGEALQRFPQCNIKFPGQVILPIQTYTPTKV
jgi:hypothetical protein